jgi:F-type H+-transporting ATPase subunit epsilon
MLAIDIISPDKKLYSGNAQSVRFPGTNGSFGILKNHAPVISTLQKGTIYLVSENNEKLSFDIKGGVVEVLNNKVIVLAD